jgi:phospholipid/cholesterol/gamma-HCH transport system substrate-binding protein
MTMPQRKQMTWAQLRVGLLALVGLVLVMVGVFYVTGTRIFSPKYQLHAFLPEVEGLTLGAPVRLEGVEVGNVDAIRVAPRISGEKLDRKRNVELTLSVDRRFRDEIRSDSRVSLVTEGLLGNRYVRITRGVSDEIVPPQGEVKGEEEVAIKQIVERGADLVENLGALSKEVRDIVDGVKRGRGSLGKFLTDEELYERLNSSAAKIDQMLVETQAGRNSLGKFIANDELYQRVNSAVTRVDRLLAEVQDQKGTLGKLIYDPQVYENARQFVDKANAFLADVRAGKGSLGKLANDDQLYVNLRDSAASLKEATDKLSKGPGSTAKMFNDPQLYDNLTGLSGDLRLLIGDFRKNPNKFLHIKLTIF